MRLLPFALALLSLFALARPAPQAADTTRIRLLLRDAADAGVAGAMLSLRTESGQLLSLPTNADGVAISAGLAGKAVWLVAGQRADGRALIADSFPAGAGFRLALIPGQLRDALLRVEGERIVLDPDMIFSPGDPGELAPPTPPQLAPAAAPRDSAAAPIAGVPSPNMPASTSASVAPAGGSAVALVLALVAAGVVLLVLALIAGLARRRAS